MTTVRLKIRKDGRDRMEYLRPMTESDWKQVSGIYRRGIETNLSTFESRYPEYGEWDAEKNRPEPVRKVEKHGPARTQKQACPLSLGKAERG